MEIHIHIHNDSVEDSRKQLLSVISTINSMEKRIMSKITDFATAQTAFNARIGTAIDGVAASVSGLTDDVAALNAKILELQNSAGQVTPEDQALIDELQVSGEALATRAEAASQALAALDALTPPEVPAP